MRIACQSIVSLDFDLAQRESVGARLWEAHGLINKKYRKNLDKLKAADPRKVAVEQRKLTKHYADFLKTSTHFYKGFILRLCSLAGELPRLARIAGAMRIEVSSMGNSPRPSPQRQHLLELAVHATLLRLGDLARYRSLLRTKEPGWDVSLGFLNLANDLCPEDPNAHHQMAVVALARDNHLDALYHFFLALSAIQAPPALAKKNLAIECKKIYNAWKKHQVSKTMTKSEKFIWWFVVLQSNFHRGDEFSAQYELESQVLTDMVPLLKDEAFDDTLQKCVVISIAAESTATTQLTGKNTTAWLHDCANENLEQGDQKKPGTVQSFYFSMAFNISMMSVLLQNFVAELPGNNHDEGHDPNGFSAKICRIIPALRQYSIWLAHSSDTMLEFATTSEVRERRTCIMWQLYAEALTGIAQSYSISKLTRVAYLLEEDARTAGFAVFRNSELASFYYAKDGTLKPHFNDNGVTKQGPYLETESRLYDVIITAVNLVASGKIPLKLGDLDGHFEYDDEFGVRRASPITDLILCPSPFSPDQGNQYAEELGRSRTVECKTPMGYGANSLPANHAVGPVPSSVVDSNQAMDTDMQRMVDNLLGPHLTSADETSYGMDSQAAQEIFAPIGSNGYDNRFQSTSTMLPSLPGLYANAFTPQVNELNSRQMSPLALSTKEKRLSAAHALDEMNGFGSDRGSPWGPTRFTPNPSSYSVNQSLQESLSRQYASSSFSNSSGIFPDATQQRMNGTRAFNAGPFAVNGNDSTIYPGASDFERNVMLQSSIWNGSQPHQRSMQTPPGGQG